MPRRQTLYFCISLFFVLFAITLCLSKQLDEKYKRQFPEIILDRNGDIISQKTNNKGHYVLETKDLPKNLARLLIKKEDRFFYIHQGINPVSIVRALFHLGAGSSTISQQLVKILLGNENNRSLAIKLKEVVYTFSLELYHSKKEILTMYGNSVYLGNQAQGFATASAFYFNKSLADLTENETVQLLATLSNPTNQNPWKSKNMTVATALAPRLGINFSDSELDKEKNASFQGPAFFELRSLGVRCETTCRTTIDQKLTSKLREILERNIEHAYDKGARNGAIVILKEPENEIVALVGSPNPLSKNDGGQINMAIEPRPIGSTVKPFIYLTAFEKGARPYSLIEDREYRFEMSSGFPLYPKNYDGEYRGTVTAHEALSNSLNVPTVKTLEFVGLNSFYDFLNQKLSFIPIQPLDTYAFGIALGGLETDLLTLTHLFSIFTNEGMLSPLSISSSEKEGVATTFLPPHNRVTGTTKVSDEKYIQLVNKILQDRFTGAEQFGLKSNLNLTQTNYAVKTGTSRDFHDSWVVGYTPDFIVGVWLGNAENKPLQELSGQAGAGRIWRETMELMFATEYNKKTSFPSDKIAFIRIGNSEDFGLPEDVVSEHISVLAEEKLILEPHEHDTFQMFSSLSIPLEASESVHWLVDGEEIGYGKKISFKPRSLGTFKIEAQSTKKYEQITISITPKP